MDPTTSTSYEVRPHAWSCTCPAFAFSAYNNSDPLSSPTYEEAWDDEGGVLYDEGYRSGGSGGGDGTGIGDGNGGEEEEEEEMLDVPVDDNIIGTSEESHGHGQHEWWGGLMRVEKGGGEAPLCKHLLACLLAERWEVAGGMVEEREVGREEMAGWAAGWGG